MTRTLLAILLAFGLVQGASAQGTNPGYGPSANVWIGQGGVAPKWKPISGDCTLAATGVVTCSNISGTVGGNPTFTGTVTFSGTINDTGVFQIGGTTQTFPASGQIVGVGDTQVLTNKSIDASEINSGVLAAARLPLATSGVKGIVQGDGASLTISGGNVISCTTSTIAQIGCVKPDNVTITVNGAGAITAVGAVAASIDAGGSTSITNGANGQILIQTAGKVAETTTTGTVGSSVVLATSPTLSGTIGGNLTLSGNLTFSGLLTPGVIGGSLCASAGGAVYYFSGNNCFGAGVTAINALTGNVVLNPVVSASGTAIALPVPLPRGRLTLQTGTPVMTTSQTTQGTLYYDCYKAGNLVPYFDGTIDRVDTISACEVSDAMVSAASAGQAVANNVYDVWWVHSGANRICLAMSTAGGGGGGWSSDTAGSNTARGTGYSQLDTTTRSSFITNKNAIANCFNAATNYGSVPVNQATYLGTVATDAAAAGKISYTFGGTASGGTAGRFGVWNAYNHVVVTSVATDNGALYAYGAAAWRAARAGTGMAMTFVTGMAEEGFTTTWGTSTQTPATNGAFMEFGIGLDTTASPNLAGNIVICYDNAASLTFCSTTYSATIAPATLGLHVITGLEFAGSGTHSLNATGSNALTLNARM